MERTEFGKKNKVTDLPEKYIWTVHKEQEYIFPTKFIRIRQKLIQRDDIWNDKQVRNEKPDYAKPKYSNLGIRLDGDSVKCKWTIF